eukprot:3091346-Lingulodinium_polyedra.AAC.1
MTGNVKWRLTASLVSTTSLARWAVQGAPRACYGSLTGTPTCRTAAAWHPWHTAYLPSMSALVLTTTARGPSVSPQPALWSTFQAECRVATSDRHPGSPSPWS